MELIFDGHQLPVEKIINQMTLAAELALTSENVRLEDMEVSVTFVDMEEIRELNKLYRGQDKVTDVLSFPQFNSPKDIPTSGVTTLGDVVICTEQALLQADDFGHSAERELVYLFTHSIFHLLGYDHMEEEDKEAMRQAEEAVMSLLSLERAAQLHV